MAQPITRATTLTLLVLMIGCSLSHPKIPQVINLEKVYYTVQKLEEHRTNYQNAVIGTNQNLQEAKYWRDTMINLVRRDIESFYREYEGRLASSRRNVASAVDVTSLAGVAAATITRGERAKTVIATMVAFVQGGHAKIDRNIFRDRTIDVIIQKMRASRTKVDTTILKNMTEMDAIQYTFSEAERDLRELFWAGTLEAAFLELAVDTGGDAERARIARDKYNAENRPRFIPTVTKQQLDLSFKVNQKVHSLESAWVQNPTSPVGQAAVQEVKAALEKLGVSVPPEATPETIFNLLRGKLREAAQDPAKLTPIAEALGVK